MNSPQASISPEDRMNVAAQILWKSRHNAALTGAGISVESGIPDFRSADGLWQRYKIMEYGTISAFRSNPEKVWRMLAEMERIIRRATPNLAHKALGRLEHLGLLDAVITQNIDNLHQEGGSTNVIEFHGNSKRLICLSCDRKYRYIDLAGQMPPLCACGKYLKPDMVFFGEAIPQNTLNESFDIVSDCNALLVIGTSAKVAPASILPGVAKRTGASVIEINIEPSMLTGSVTDIFLQGRAGEIVPALVKKIEELMSEGR